MALRTNSDYFLMQSKLIGFITETKCFYCAVRDELLNIIMFILVLNCLIDVVFSHIGMGTSA